MCRTSTPFPSSHSVHHHGNTHHFFSIELKRRVKYQSFENDCLVDNGLQHDYVLHWSYHRPIEDAVFARTETPKTTKRFNEKRINSSKIDTDPHSMRALVPATSVSGLFRTNLKSKQSSEAHGMRVMIQNNAVALHQLW